MKGGSNSSVALESNFGATPVHPGAPLLRTLPEPVSKTRHAVVSSFLCDQTAYVVEALGGQPY